MARTKKRGAKKLWQEVKALPPQEWALFEEAFDRIKMHVGWDLAERDLRQGILDRRLIAAARVVARDGTETRMRLDPMFVEPFKLWRHSPKDFVVLDGEGPSGEWPSGELHLFVRRRELDKHYPATMPSERPNDPLQPPPRRRGPPPNTQRWFSICAEIARRCITKTGRVQVPKSENKLADEVLDWLAENEQGQPSASEMREAVKRVCAALRTAQK
jgi:hypothetical protein